MILFVSLVFVATACLALAALSALQRDPVRERLTRLRELAAVRRLPTGAGVLVADEPSLVGRWVSSLSGSLGDANSTSVSKARQRLATGGYRKPSHVRIYLGGRVAFAVLLPLLVTQTPLSEGLEPLRLTLLLCLAAALGTVVPSYLLDRRIRSRQRAIETGLPDALDLMVVCIESGLGLQASIARVAAEFVRSNPALAEEFELVALETRAGRSGVAALRGLAERTGVPEVSALVAMLIQTERFGTSVADALRVQSSSMRRRRMQRAEETASKAPLKMLFPAGVFIFPATLIVIAGPGAIKLLGALQGS